MTNSDFEATRYSLQRVSWWYTTRRQPRIKRQNSKTRRQRAKRAIQRELKEAA